MSRYSNQQLNMKMNKILLILNGSLSEVWHDLLINLSGE